MTEPIQKKLDKLKRYQLQIAIQQLQNQIEFKKYRLWQGFEEETNIAALELILGNLIGKLEEKK